MTACTAVHMLNVQQNVLNKLDSVQVKTLIATGTNDSLTSQSGIRITNYNPAYVIRIT